MPRIILPLLVLAVLAVAGYVVIPKQDQKPTGSPQVLSASAEHIPAVTALLVQVDEENNKRRILECSPDGCEVKQAPKSVGSDPLSSGTDWYRYTDKGEEDSEKTVLERIYGDGTAATITEQSSLVKPRSLMISSEGSKLAYFLDNIHDAAAKLTELWVYDSQEDGAKVVAEKLYKPDIASKVRWNTSGRTLWFLQDGKKKQLMVVPLGRGQAASQFSSIDWNEFSSIADRGVMDINDDASLLAFSAPTVPGFSQLLVVEGDGKPVKKSIKGRVVFLRWMDKHELLYAVQDGENLAFWKVNKTAEWPITRLKATFRSAHSAGTSNLATFVADPKKDEPHLYVLQISTGLVKDEVQIPLFGDTTYVVQANEAQVEQEQAVASISGALSDDILVAFLEKRIGEITEDGQAKAERIITTDVANTLYVEYTSGGTKSQRILLTVIDTVHPEWKILASYDAVGGQWKRQQEAGSSEPNARMVYEWEGSVGQWIVKETY